MISKLQLNPQLPATSQIFQSSLNLFSQYLFLKLKTTAANIIRNYEGYGCFDENITVRHTSLTFRQYRCQFPYVPSCDRLYAKNSHLNVFPRYQFQTQPAYKHEVSLTDLQILIITGISQ